MNNKISGKNVMVTGGAGFIGSHLVDELVARNANSVTVVDNFFLGQEENLRSARNNSVSLNVLRLDASDLAAMTSVVRNFQIDTVFDLAVVPLPTSLTYPSWTVLTNIAITNNFCELLRNGEIEKFVHLSSSEAYGTARYVPMDELHPHDALTPYAASKSAGDQLINSYNHTFNLNAVVIRPFNNFGPRQNPGTYAGIIPIVIRNVLDQVPITIFGDGNQTRDFLFVRETDKGVCDLYTISATGGMCLNLGSGVETSIIDLIQLILIGMGKPNHPIAFSPERPGDVRRHCADMTLTSSILGRTPPSINEEHIEQTIKWYIDFFGK